METLILMVIFFLAIQWLASGVEWESTPSRRIDR